MVLELADADVSFSAEEAAEEMLASLGAERLASDISNHMGSDDVTIDLERKMDSLLTAMDERAQSVVRAGQAGSEPDEASAADLCSRPCFSSAAVGLSSEKSAAAASHRSSKGGRPAEEALIVVDAVWENQKLQVER